MQSLAHYALHKHDFVQQTPFCEADINIST